MTDWTGLFIMIAIIHVANTWKNIEQSRLQLKLNLKK